MTTSWDCRLERHFAKRNVHIGMVVDRLEVGDEAVDEAERVDEVLKLERSGECVVRKCPPSQPGMMRPTVGLKS